MKKNLNELGKNALNYLSAILFNPPEAIYAYGEVSAKTHPIYTSHREYWRPCENWQQGGSIIKQEGISISLLHNALWCAAYPDDNDEAFRYNIQKDISPLVAVVRSYIEHHLGTEIDIPEEYLDD